MSVMIKYKNLVEPNLLQIIDFAKKFDYKNQRISYIRLAEEEIYN
jgi:hypothetical protein